MFKSLKNFFSKFSKDDVVDTINGVVDVLDAAREFAARAKDVLSIIAAAISGYRSSY